MASWKVRQSPNNVASCGQHLRIFRVMYVYIMHTILYSQQSFDKLCQVSVRWCPATATDTAKPAVWHRNSAADGPATFWQQKQKELRHAGARKYPLHNKSHIKQLQKTCQVHP